VRLLGVVALCAACGAPPAEVGHFMLELGGSDEDGSGFVELAGDRPLVQGAQGGFHVWVKFRISGMASQKVKVVRTARRAADGALVLKSAPITEEIGAENEAVWELPMAMPAFMCPTPVGVRVADQSIVFTLAIEDLDGVRLVETSATATPRCPPGPQAEFCTRICDG